MRLDKLPSPALVLLGFRDLLGFQPYGPEEKMEWGIEFEFDGAVFAYESRKFGLRLICEHDALDTPVVADVLGRTRGLVDVVEQYLAATVIPAQLAAGNVTVTNMYGQLRERYTYLRSCATNAYAQQLSPLSVENEDPMAHFVAYWNHQARTTQEGGTLGTAAVDAYFSSLEHLFVLASAFIPNALGGGLRAVLKETWSERARRLLSLKDPQVKKTYDQLVNVREDWRNPLAHGGFHVGDGSLFVHTDVGALPARLRRTPDGVKASFQLHQSSFSEICEVFDRFDDLAKRGTLHCAIRWAEAGHDVAFDKDSLAKYRAATESVEALDALIQRENYLYELRNNMDY